jgi:multidrug resistance efflux pump
MAKGRFNIKGTKDFLVMAVFCAFLGIWSIRDAWFPAEKVLKKHPPEIAAAFSLSGAVKSIPVQVGQEIAGKVVLASLYDEAHRAAVTEAEAAFEAAKAVKDPSVEEKLNALMTARQALEACEVKNTDITWESSHGKETLRGTVTRILVQPGERVEAGAPVLMVKPVDSFYAFNKTLAVLSLIGVIVALIFHRIASH